MVVLVGWCWCGGVFVVVFLWWCWCGGVGVVDVDVDVDVEKMMLMLMWLLILISGHIQSIFWDRITRHGSKFFKCRVWAKCKV